MMLGRAGGFPMNWMKPWITRICVAGKLGLLTLAACAAQQGSVPRAVDLTATDGTKLKATFFSAGKAGPGALLLHQCNGQRKGWDALAEQLATAGISVLSLDYRGYGDSEGKAPKDLPQAEGMKVLNEKWPSDLDVAYNYLVFQAGINAKMVGAGGRKLRREPGDPSGGAPSRGEVAGAAFGECGSPGAHLFLSASEKIPVLLSAADDDAARWN
jgi:hypothetical protein